MSPNEQAVARIVAHHRAMVGELDRRVGELVRAVEAGVPHAPALAAVSEYLVSDVFPHARAEEATLYAAARGQELRSLVAAMVDEHRWLLDAARELREAGSGVAAAAAARAVAAIFALHARKENEHLLPPLAADPAVDLAGLLAAMQAALREGDKTMEREERVLDVRALPPPRRHGLIFETFERLAPGGSFVLVNDHDPKPLYYQFAAERAGTFTWEYLETGPEVWRVRIGRSLPGGGTAR